MSIVNTLSLESNRQIKINFDGGYKCRVQFMKDMNIKIILQFQ